MKAPVITFIKNVSSNNKIIIPKIVIEKFGKQFYMEVHDDRIVLLPVKK